MTATSKSGSASGSVDHAVQGVIDVGRYLGDRGLLPATSGNLSARIDTSAIAITRSGAEKGELSEKDVILVRLDQPLPPDASAETALHVAHYRRSPAIGAVLHTHSLASTVVSDLLKREGRVIFRGYEMQKAMQGFKTHESEVVLPIFANSQDIPALAETVMAGLADIPDVSGYLLAAHGLYAWGGDIREARRHITALEFLLSCKLETLRIGGARGTVA
jgi:methylthioribulose-1-phosphate dehydratase